MNLKQLTLLIALVAILGGAGLVLSKKKAATYESSSGKVAKLLDNFDLNAVAEIHVKQAAGEMTLHKKDDIWCVKDRGDYPANFDTITEFLRKVWELKPVEKMQMSTSYLPRLELVEPGKGDKSGTLVEFKDKSGKVMTALMLGKNHLREEGGNSQFGGGSFPDGRYVMIGNDINSVSLVTEPFTNVEPKPDQWENKDFFKVEGASSISITSTNTAADWSATRPSVTGEWALANLKGTEKLDKGAAGGFGSILTTPAFNDVETKAADWKDATKVQMETFDHFKYAVTFAKKGESEDYLLKVAVAADLPKERTSGKDEKPEDKTRLDKEFKDKQARLEEKLKAEKKLEPWTFVVGKWIIEPLLKDRKDLLEKPKEEPKAESKPETK